MDRKKKISLIFISVTILILLAFWIYSIFAKKEYTPENLQKKDSLLPFQNGTVGTGNGNIPAQVGTSTTPNLLNNIPVNRLRQITKEPTSGSIILARDRDVIKERIKVKESGYFIRYVDRATGHISEVKSDSSNPQKISNFTIPKVYSAMFGGIGDSVMMRLLDDQNEKILTYHITLSTKNDTKNATTTATTTPTKSSEKSLKDVVGNFLELDIKEAVITPSGNKIVYELYDGQSGRFAVYDIKTKKSRNITTLPLRDWLLNTIDENRVLITTKPSGIAKGLSFILDTNSGSVTKVYSGVGLTSLPQKNGSFIFGIGGGSMSLFYKKNIDAEIEIVNSSTLPEKCVWSKLNNKDIYCAVPAFVPKVLYPDTWYKGQFFFSDNIWKIDLETGETKLLSNLSKESEQTIDATNLEISPDDNYITFINKIDLTLWGLDIIKKN